MAGITEQNYESEFKAFLKRDGATKTEPSKSYIMIRPDRPFDKISSRYQNGEERETGDKAMLAWFEYFAAKKMLIRHNGWKQLRIYVWRAMLDAGNSIMVPCADPCGFDLMWEPPVTPALPVGFFERLKIERTNLDSRFDTLEYRTRCAKILKDCAAEIKMANVKRPPAEHVRPLRKWESTPLAEVDATKPLPKLSAAAMASIKST